MPSPALQPTDPLSRGTVLDFWRWAMSDLKMNTARGYLAEYLVAEAVGGLGKPRVEWDPWDVTAKDGTRIEVKATGLLQSWHQSTPSTPRWSFKSVNARRVWNDATATYDEIDPAERVHVWVFALQTCAEPGAYDQLAVDQWEFRVVPHRRLLETRQQSAGLSLFDRLGIHAVPHSALAAAIAGARKVNEAMAAEPSDGAVHIAEWVDGDATLG